LEYLFLWLTSSSDWLLWTGWWIFGFHWSKEFVDQPNNIKSSVKILQTGEET
jgi:hypothetical protein